MLARLPRILQTIIEEAIVEQFDMEVIRGDDRAELAALVATRDIDVAIIGEDDVDAVCALLGARPQLDVLAVVPAARETLLYEMRPCRVRLGELSVESLVQAIREAGQNAQARSTGTMNGGVLEAAGSDR